MPRACFGTYRSAALIHPIPHPSSCGQSDVLCRSQHPLEEMYVCRPPKLLPGSRTYCPFAAFKPPPRTATHSPLPAAMRVPSSRCSSSEPISVRHNASQRAGPSAWLPSGRGSGVNPGPVDGPVGRGSGLNPGPVDGNGDGPVGRPCRRAECARVGPPEDAPDGGRAVVHGTLRGPCPRALSTGGVGSSSNDVARDVACDVSCDVARDVARDVSWRSPRCKK
jgi:hypothetical protein